jgi:hypothetical protein
MSTGVAGCVGGVVDEAEGDSKFNRLLTFSVETSDQEEMMRKRKQGPRHALFV